MIHELLVKFYQDSVCEAQQGEICLKGATNIRALPRIVALASCIAIPEAFAQSDDNNKTIFLVAEKA